MRIVAVIGSGALALTQPTMARAETVRWKCDSRSIATPKGVAVEKFSLEFALDSVTKKAVIIGNDGISDVRRLAAIRVLHFKKR